MKNIVVHIFILFSIAMLLIGCQKKDVSEEINPILEKYLEAWNEGNLDVLDKITSLDFEMRINPDFKANRSRDFLKESITNTRNDYPDFLVTVDEKLFISDTAVVVHWTITGTNTGEGSHPPTGKKTSSNGFSVIFFNDGKITGEWIGYSDLTWLKQLGFIITPPWPIEE